MQDLQDPVTGALDRLVSKIDQLAKDQQDHRSQNAADLASLSMDLKRARDEVLEWVAVLENDLNERVAALELAARSAEAIHADCQGETVAPQPAPPRLVEALRGPARETPVAVPLGIPGRSIVAHIDPDPGLDPDETMGRLVALYRPGA